MLTIGDRFPAFQLKAVTSDALNFPVMTDASDAEQWKVFFFWPKDFTFVCPTEIEGFGALYKDFQTRNCQVYGASTDSDFVHHAWRNSHPGLKTLPFPMLSDVNRDLSTALGILHPTEGVCYRATFVVDPEGIIRHVSVNDLSVGRSPEEILRIVDGLQSGELCGCNWQKGQAHLTVAQ